MHSSPKLRGAICGLAAAALFGVSPPLTKLLLAEASPLVLAGLLYTGAGLGLLVFEFFSNRASETYPREAAVRGADLWLLAGITVLGGIVGPVCMLWGLQRLSAVLGSLLLNLEAPFTILLAVILFREHMGRQETAGAILIFAAAAVLGYHPEDVQADLVGLLAIVGACLSWALDNNLTQRLSLRDPLAVTRIKALGAGLCALALAGIGGESLPHPSIMFVTMSLGLLSFGLSLILDLYALRLIGAAREAGFFATAPFIGAVAAVPLLGERWGLGEVLATALMAMGVVLLVREHHAHDHTHQVLEHDHAHVHRDHHEHEHAGKDEIVEPHAHHHRHLPITHDHPHVSELHHRHEHG